jgi:hypothetical protein
MPVAEHVPTTSMTIEDGPSPTPTMTNQVQGEVAVEGRQHQGENLLGEYKWITQLRGSSAT